MGSTIKANTRLHKMGHSARKKRKKSSSSNGSGAQPPSDGVSDVVVSGSPSSTEVRAQLVEVTQELSKLTAPAIDSDVKEQHDLACGPRTDEQFASFLSKLDSTSDTNVDYRVEYEEAALLARKSFLEEARRQATASDVGEKSTAEKKAFKDTFVETFTQAFKEDLETLQHDKLFQEMGSSTVRLRPIFCAANHFVKCGLTVRFLQHSGQGLGLELLALALETGHSTYNSEQRDMFVHTIQEMKAVDEKANQQ